VNTVRKMKLHEAEDWKRRCTFKVWTQLRLYISFNGVAFSLILGSEKCKREELATSWLGRKMLTFGSGSKAWAPRCSRELTEAI
jgi:hypothetical protein